MYRTFNCSVGMFIALPANQLKKGLTLLKAEGENAWHIGHIAKAADGEEQVVIQ